MLFANLEFNFTDVTSEQRHKALLSLFDDVDLVKSHRVQDFFPLLKLTLRTLDEAGLAANVIVVACAEN